MTAMFQFPLYLLRILCGFAVVIWVLTLIVSMLTVAPFAWAYNKADELLKDMQ